MQRAWFDDEHDGDESLVETLDDGPSLQGTQSTVQYESWTEGLVSSRTGGRKV